jgi:hypothetical protein
MVQHINNSGTPHALIAYKLKISVLAAQVKIGGFSK